MVLRCLHGDRNRRNQSRIHRCDDQTKPSAGGGDPRREGPTMLSAAFGMMTMLPVVFGVAGYVMVSR
jgi:hypothetical protein